MVDIAEIQAFGKTFHVPPIPPIPEATEWVSAGPLSIGIEFRNVSSDQLEEAYPDAPEEIRELLKVYAEAQIVIVDRGVSFHVCDAATGAEYLRFDAFGREPDSAGPHYHYIIPERNEQTVVNFDDFAHGPITDWVIERLRGEHLPRMLRRAGADALADQVEQRRSKVDAAIPEVIRLANEASVRIPGAS